MQQNLVQDKKQQICTHLIHHPSLAQTFSNHAYPACASPKLCELIFQCNLIPVKQIFFQLTLTLQVFFLPFWNLHVNMNVAPLQRKKTTIFMNTVVYINQVNKFVWFFHNISWLGPRQQQQLFIWFKAIFQNHTNNALLVKRVKGAWKVLKVDKSRHFFSIQ